MISKQDAFEACLAPLATEHRLYLEDAGRTLADCYTLEITARNERLEIDPDVPHDLYDAIRECFVRCFS